jgi:hypothetical protein
MRAVPPSQRACPGLLEWRGGEPSDPLRSAGLLTVKRVPQGDEYVYTRLRNSYWLETAVIVAAVSGFVLHLAKATPAVALAGSGAAFAATMTLGMAASRFLSG